MTPYIVAETGDTPRIEMNAEKGIFLLKGKSLPENAHLFYDPVVKWMSMYRAQANQPGLPHLQTEQYFPILRV